MSEEIENENNGEEEEEINLDDDTSDDYVYVYGIPLPQLPEGLQPIECVILIEGIMMESGQPTITALGSEGMKPWTAVGMLEMEAERLKSGYIFGGIHGTGFAIDDDDDEEDDEY